MAATTRLFRTASSRPGRPSGFSHASSENCLKFRFDRPVGSLKLNRIITATGKMRYAVTPKAYRGRIHRSMARPSRLLVPGAAAVIAVIDGSTRASDPGPRQLFGTDETAVDEDAYQDRGHEDERESRRGRVVDDPEVARLDHVADHLGLRVAQE